MKNSNPLFQNQTLYDVRHMYEQAMYKEIREFSVQYIINTPSENLCAYLESKYLFDIPTLLETEISLDHFEGQLVRYDRHLDREYTILGTTYVFVVPFEGDRQIFQYRPETHFANPPKGIIEKSHIEFLYFEESNSSGKQERIVERIKQSFEDELRLVRETLDFIRQELAPFQSSLRSNAYQQIEGRRQKILKDQGIAASLGYPLKKREDALLTYKVPEVRRKILVRPPLSEITPQLEPALDMQQYEDILGILNNMVLVIEKSPHVFSRIVEEDFRTHFLVQLNGQYEGQATGETFNFSGKTDILIRVDGKNIFIAECKFWKGAENFTETIDQILGYISWRDTKTAILLFNRNKNLSNVLEQIPNIVKTHPNFVRVANNLSGSSETQFRYIMSHRDDANRELMLTVMVFEVPI